MYTFASWAWPVKRCNFTIPLVLCCSQWKLESVGALSGDAVHAEAGGTGACCFFKPGEPDTCSTSATNPEKCPNIPACENEASCTGELGCSLGHNATWCADVTPAPALKCEGNPLQKLQWTADGQCVSPDAATCQGIFQTPACSYNMSVDGGGDFLFVDGIWKTANCQGDVFNPRAAHVSYPIGTCVNVDSNMMRF